MVIESDKVTVKASSEEVFNFLKDAQNIYHLLPQDKISEWKADETQCSFKIQGAATISLVQDELTPNSGVEDEVRGEVSFSVSLDDKYL